MLNDKNKYWIKSTANLRNKVILFELAMITGVVWTLKSDELVKLIADDIQEFNIYKQGT